jgi:hypothetical protein
VPALIAGDYELESVGKCAAIHSRIAGEGCQACSGFQLPHLQRVVPRRRDRAAARPASLPPHRQNWRSRLGCVAMARADARKNGGQEPVPSEVEGARQPPLNCSMERLGRRPMWEDIGQLLLVSEQGKSPKRLGLVAEAHWRRSCLGPSGFRTRTGLSRPSELRLQIRAQAFLKLVYTPLHVSTTSFAASSSETQCLDR